MVLHFKSKKNYVKSHPVMRNGITTITVSSLQRSCLHLQLASELIVNRPIYKYKYVKNHRQFFDARSTFIIAVLKSCLQLVWLSLFRCFAIDRSGFVVIHKDFLNNPPNSEVHITTKEPQIAAELVQMGIMRNDSCVSYADITNQLFWEVRHWNI